MVIGYFSKLFMVKLDTIYIGNCLETLADVSIFPDHCIDCCITSPPYWKQRSYNGVGDIGVEHEFANYSRALVTMFGHVLRVLKPNGTIALNLGDKREGGLMLAPYRVAIDILTAFPTVRLINHVTWIKANPTPRQDQTKLISATEPFFIFSPSKHYYFDKVEFMKEEDEDKPTQKVGDRVGQGYRTLIDESALTEVEKQRAHADLDTTIQDIKDGKIAGLRMKIRGKHALAYGGQDGGRNRQIINNGYSIIRLKDEPNKRDVIETCVESIKGNKHPAVYPVSLIEQFIKLLTPVGAVILDPFSGSGSTAIAAKRLQRHFIGVEIDPEYHAYSMKRLNNPFQFEASR